MFAKKSLGQHFLRSGKALGSIVRAGDIREGETVLEIGPGEGVLTSALLEAGAKVIAVEKDDSLFENLKINYEQEIAENKLELIHADILDLDPGTLPPYKLVANIPYNITGAIIRKFLASPNQPKRMVLLVQKEVAERIVAREGKESILSLSVKAYGTPKYVETVKAGSFTPPPKVDSAILSIENISREFFKDISEEAFFAALHAGFVAKRKKLSSNLAAIYPKEKILEAFERLGLDPNVRAEDVPLEDWKRILEIK